MAQFFTFQISTEMICQEKKRITKLSRTVIALQYIIQQYLLNIWIIEKKMAAFFFIEFMVGHSLFFLLALWNKIGNPHALF